jgi:bifunctional UDP-N-acetylglucosamine pyrophosphorylase / glucosamine-1-phosphate N-acetyltransferase
MNIALPRKTIKEQESEVYSMGGVAAIVMAAGKGTRMKSKYPKVLHQISGKPLVAHVVQSLKEAYIDDVTVVIGHGRELVEEALGSEVKYAYQFEQLGTGHAVLQAKGQVDKTKIVLVVSGDTPLLSPETLTALVDRHRKTGANVTVLTAVPDSATGYGRIVRNESGLIREIVEEKDATPDIKEIKEINTGTYCFSGEFLFQALQNIKPNNAQNEYYLTDVISLSVEAGLPVAAEVCEDPRELQGINSREQLAEAAQVMNQKIAERLMAEGVTILDPRTTFIERDVRVGRDSVILPFTFLQGQTTIGEDCTVGPNSRVFASKLANGVIIEQSVVKEAEIGEFCSIGPFAYLRPGTILGSKVKVGDFVEIKKSFIEEGSKIPHLSYVGDAHIGKNVNVGAGTITCNYDGKRKFTTEIEDNAFIGSNTNLVAPVKVGSGAMVAAGSTITKNVPGLSLGVARAKQINVENWAKRK